MNAEPRTIRPDSALPCQGLVLNIPDAFENPEFREWLNAAVEGRSAPVMTWHQGGCPGQWSDVVVLVDPGLSGEGTDTDMPQAVWSAIVEAVREAALPTTREHIMVRLTNLRV